MLGWDNYIASATALHREHMVTPLRCSHALVSLALLWKIALWSEKSCKILLSCSLNCKICLYTCPVLRVRYQTCPCSLCYHLGMSVHMRALDLIMNLIFCNSLKILWIFISLFLHFSDVEVIRASPVLYRILLAIARARTWTALEGRWWELPPIHPAAATSETPGTIHTTPFFITSRP